MNASSSLIYRKGPNNTIVSVTDDRIKKGGWQHSTAENVGKKQGVLHPLHAMHSLGQLGVPAIKLRQPKTLACCYSTSIAFLSMDDIKCDMQALTTRSSMTSFPVKELSDQKGLTPWPVV